MNNVDKYYEFFLEKQQQLLSLVQRQLQILRALGMKEIEENIRYLEERVSNLNFKVLVLGEFKRGKSTFINSLLRQSVLPAYSTPTTAIINEVKWGETPKALLHYRSSDTEIIPPQEIPIDEIESYVTIQDFNQSADELQDSQYEKVELFWPLELCRQGVEIIDSPGLNENVVRQQITMDYLGQVDAILFVLTCLQLGPSQSEKDVIDRLHDYQHQDIFFICNFFNNIQEKEKQRTTNHALSQFSKFTNLEQNGIFFITASEALEGYEENNQDKIQKSGIQKVEQNLAQFLTKEKGRIKIQRSQKVLRDSMIRARDVIPEREAMLRTDVKTLEARYAAAQESLNKLERDRQNIILKISNTRSDLKDLVQSKARDFFDQAAKKVDIWIGGYKVKAPIKLLSTDVFQLENAVKRIVDEVTKFLSSKVEAELKIWQKDVLQPFLSSRLSDLTNDLDDKAQHFVTQVDATKMQIITGSTEIKLDNIQVQGAKISAMERILAGISGFVMMDYGAAIMGGLFGYQEMLKSLIPQLATVIVTVAIAGFNPWILIPAILGSASISGLFKAASLTEKAKETVAKEYANQIRMTNKAGEMAQAVADKLGEIQTAVDQGLGNELQSIRTQVESVLTEKRAGQANVNGKLQELKSLQQELNQIDLALTELMQQI